MFYGGPQQTRSATRGKWCPRAGRAPPAYDPQKSDVFCRVNPSSSRPFAPELVPQFSARGNLREGRPQRLLLLDRPPGAAQKSSSWLSCGTHSSCKMFLLCSNLLVEDEHDQQHHTGRDCTGHTGDACLGAIGPDSTCGALEGGWTTRGCSACL
jgi:hypothetical protein